MAGLDENARRQLESLGDFIRAQREMAELSLRELAARTNVSNPYLSQIERGLHEPSVRVLKAIAGALNMSAESLMKQAGMLEGDSQDESTDASIEAAIDADRALRPDQRSALLTLYRSFVDSNEHEKTKKPRA